MIFPEIAVLTHADPVTGPDVSFRCFMVPISPDNVARQNVPNGMLTKVTYHMVHPELPPPHVIRAKDYVVWRGIKLSVIGVPMLVTANGRVHHYETYLGVEAPGG